MHCKVFSFKNNKITFYKIIGIIFIITVMFSTTIYARPITSRDRVDIFSLAFESILPEEYILKEIDYIAIDMLGERFNKLSQEEKDKIVDYIKKYNEKIIVADLEILKRNGYLDENDALSSNKGRGILLKITSTEALSDKKIVVYGKFYKSNKIKEEYKNVISFKKGKWYVSGKKDIN